MQAALNAELGDERRLHSLAVLFPWQWVSGTVFGSPSLASFIVQEVELQNANVNRAPFNVL